ncbi:DUF192 domain-containing protein [Robiginitalea sp. SC105]|uniref:DUF192 domain-containing protein n=1 Tax=Robiginitalea sp. SC105 TaxID=2762332 RepID=UPI00163AA56B|nr:DUF192 domain-containing protein [Robiginitalea sp. SC105]MBC2839759.1 DUF192 domain-containing protein [Robiginitalea sp. SC105]
MPDFRPIRFLSALALAACCCLGSCRDTPKTPLERETVSFTKEGVLRILDAETDSIKVVLDIEIADSEYETQTGLMYRNEMRDDRGMLFVFDAPALHAFYMKNTMMPLDILFIDSNLEIATIRQNARPLDESSISSGVPVQYVLEVNAGLSAKWGLEAGDRITYQKSQ